jgi:N-acetylglutamate synthase-like GNAT family acetyltransferase
MKTNKDKIKISLMKRSDINLVAEYMQEMLKEDLGESWTKEASRHYLKQDYKYNKEYFLVAKEEGVIIGGLAAIPSFGENGQDLYISMVIVRKDKRGGGVGKKLFDKVSQLAKKNGLKGIRLLAHLQLFSLNWYRKLGFKETGWLEFKKDF